MALSKRAIGSGKWQKLRIQILDRDGWVCVVCNKPAHTVDHIVPRVRGGSMWEPSNLQSMQDLEQMAQRLVARYQVQLNNMAR